VSQSQFSLTRATLSTRGAQKQIPIGIASLRVDHYRLTGYKGPTVPTVFANWRGVAHKGSGRQSRIFSDVTNSGPTSVKTDGQMPTRQSAHYMVSTGDEADSAMGVMSNKIKGTCDYRCRLPDPLFHNEKNGRG